MRRIGWTWRCSILGPLVGLALIARAGDVPEERLRDDVDLVLGEWQKQMATVTSIDVKFRRKLKADRDRERLFEGRAILKRPNLASIEFTPLDEEGRPTADRERIVWTGKDVLVFSGKDVRVDAYRFDHEWAGPPEALCMPFLFGMSLDRAKERYAWKNLGQAGHRVFLAAERKADPPESPNVGRYIVELDRERLLPVRIIVDSQAGRNRDTYEVVDLKVNVAVAEDELRAPCLDSWKVFESGGSLVRWLFR